MCAEVRCGARGEPREGAPNMRHRRSRRFAARLIAIAAPAVAVGGLLVGMGGSPASASSGPVQVSGKPIFTTVGGATPLPTDRTVPHWFGSFTDPTNSVTYGYNMVGNGDPRTYAGTTTVPTEIIPMNFTFSNGQQFNGSDVTQAMVSSPIWQDTSWAKARVTPGGPEQ